MSLDFSRCRLTPFAHQREDVFSLMQHKWFFVASEMRTGKTKIVIDAAQFLFIDNVIDRVIVVAPAAVRDVWYDRTLGEIAKHSFLDVPARITEFHQRIRTWLHTDIIAERKLDWYVSNFEFLRSKNRLAQLMAVCGPRTMLVVDESSFAKNWKAQQTIAVMQLRYACGRVVLLNGTPIFHSPLDLFSQGNILHHSVHGCKYITHFKARYAVQVPILGPGGKPVTDPRGKAVLRVDSWTNLDDLQQRFTPVTVRRLQKDCLDLPPKLDPVVLTATLDTEWPAYKKMRDNLVVWLSESAVATAATAATKVMRLSQITSGILGGVEEPGFDVLEDGFLESLSLGAYDDERGAAGDHRQASSGGVETDSMRGSGISGNSGRDPTRADGLRDEAATGCQEVGRAKLDVLLWFLSKRLEEDPNVKVVAWCRFRAELFRIVAAVQEKFPQFKTAMIIGGQKRHDRIEALGLLKPETAPIGPVFVAGIEKTGSFGLDMTASHTCVTMSSGYSPGVSAQTLDRVYGPGQKHPIAYFNVLAVGPRGERTIDHKIEEARRAGADIAEWTASQWVKALTEE